MKKNEIKEMIRKAIDEHSEIRVEGIIGWGDYITHEDHQTLKGKHNELQEALDRLYSYLGVELKCSEAKPAVCKLIKKKNKKRSKKHDKKETNKT